MPKPAIADPYLDLIVTYAVYAVGDPKKTIDLDVAFDELIEIIAERNPDFYEVNKGELRRAQ